MLQIRGGVIIYIHNNLNSTHVDISSKMSDNDETKPNWESLFIEINQKSTNSKTHIIGHISADPMTWFYVATIFICSYRNFNIITKEETLFIYSWGFQL